MLYNNENNIQPKINFLCILYYVNQDNMFVCFCFVVDLGKL